MRSLLSTVHFNGVVVIGEGEKDEAPMLYNGQHIGDGIGPECDVALDPIDGTRLAALGINNALAVLAVAERGTGHHPLRRRPTPGPQVGILFPPELKAGNLAASPAVMTGPETD